MRAIYFMPLTLLAVALAACDQDSSATSKATNAPASGSDPLSAPADYLRAISDAEKTAVKVVDTASISQAVQLFNVEHGRNPKSLQELVDEKFLPQVPRAPRGMKIVYDPSSGKVSVVKE